MSAPLIHNQPEYSVSEVSLALKRTVEDAFEYVRVRGEISGFKRADSGHLYLNLKDDKSVLAAVCWKGVAVQIPFTPEDGLEVVCTGRITTYPGRSTYQLVIEKIEHAGLGALMALLEKRKKQLAAEGLFDPARKRPIPFLPTTIGVVTSPTGAVIKDILHRLSERFPVHVLLWPVLVQGDQAAGQIAAAIYGFNSIAGNSGIPRPDVLIVARGGGSLEDLWPFNEEMVVRATAASQIPIISAVGHETDTTLIDFASDRRAPTPTAAAEMAVPVRSELLIGLHTQHTRILSSMERYLNEKKERLEGYGRGLPKPQTLLEMASQKLDDLQMRLQVALPNLLASRQQQLAAASASLRPQPLLRDIERLAQRTQELAGRAASSIHKHLEKSAEAVASRSRLLESFNYKNVLKRGFAVVRDAKHKPVTSAQGIAAGSVLHLEFKDGEHKVVSAESTLPPTPVAKKKPAKDVRQGDLF